MQRTPTVQDRLYRVYWAMRRAIVPTLRYSQYLYEEALTPLVGPDTRWLDLGCGHQVLPSWRGEQEWSLVSTARSVVGVDCDEPSLRKHRSIRCRVLGDMTQLPFAAESFDLVTANMVVEHLDNPRVQFAEISRVLRPGGLFVFHTPNAHSHFVVLARLVPRRVKRQFVGLLDGRPPDDVFPAFYRANSRRAIEALAPETGLRVEKLRFVVTDAMFAPVPPVALVELLWLRVLMSRRFRALRTNIIAVMRKDATWSLSRAA